MLTASGSELRPAAQAAEDLLARLGRNAGKEGALRSSQEFPANAACFCLAWAGGETQPRNAFIDSGDVAAQQSS